VRALCPRAVLLSEGRLIHDGPTSEVLASFERSRGDASAPESWAPHRQPLAHEYRVLSIGLRRADASGANQFEFEEDILVDVHYEVLKPRPYRLKIAIINAEDLQLFFSGEYEQGEEVVVQPPGVYRSVARIPGHVLNDGTYSIGIHVDIANEKVILDEPRVLEFTVLPSARFVRFRDRAHGIICPDVVWETARESE
jgi:hypothetical protein